MTIRTRLCLVFGAFVIAGIARQGIVHHWRIDPIGGLRDCTTNVELDDGCNVFGTCLKCGDVCAPGTDPREQIALGEPHRCGIH